MLVLKRAPGGFQGGVGAQAVILKLALATATDAGAAAYRCPAWMSFAMGINAVQFGGVDLPLAVLVLSN